jgi:hypothetical protein
VGLVAKLLPGTAPAWVRESGETGKHRTEATEVTEGDGVGARNSYRDSAGLGARVRRRGKHRTEVTEVTEGDWVGGETPTGTAPALVRESDKKG